MRLLGAILLSASVIALIVVAAAVAPDLYYLSRECTPDDMTYGSCLQNRQSVKSAAIPGVLSLVGAIAGVILILIGSSRRQEQPYGDLRGM